MRMELEQHAHGGLLDPFAIRQILRVPLRHSVRNALSRVLV